MSEHDEIIEADPKPEEGTPAATKQEEVDVTQTREFKGLLLDKQRESSSRQEAERQLSYVQKELAETNARLEELANKEDPDLDDTDFVTVGATKKLLEQALGGIKADKEKDAKQQQALLVNTTSEEAKERYTAKKCGEGLDFDSVIENGLKPLIAKNPALFTAIQNDPNPAEAAYKLGKTHPDVEKLVLERMRSDLVTDLQKNTGPNKTGEQILMEESTAQATDFEAMMNKSESELLAELQAAGQ